MPKGYSKYNQGGWKHKKKSIKEMTVNRREYSNEKNPRWAGNKVSYQALHNWIRKHFIKSLFCESCGIVAGKDKSGHTKIQWANKSKNYTRDRSDWWCLCVSCHKQIDIKNRIKHKYDRK